MPSLKKKTQPQIQKKTPKSKQKNPNPKQSTICRAQGVMLNFILQFQ